MVGLSFSQACIIFLLCGIAGLIQGSAGIGFSMFVMTFMPMLLPYSLATNVNRFVGLAIAVMGLWQYRQNIRLKTVAVPALASMVTSIMGIHVFQSVNELLLKKGLAVFLLVMVVVSLILQQRKMVLGSNWLLGLFMGALAGFASGLFNVLGPILAIYYMATAETAGEYRSSLNLSFVIISSWINLFYQVRTGYAPAEWIYGLIGSVSGVAGLVISKPWAGKMDKEKVGWMMYGIIGIMAVCMLLS